jgi:hypothetical protein
MTPVENRTSEIWSQGLELLQCKIRFARLPKVPAPIWQMIPATMREISSIMRALE